MKNNVILKRLFKVLVEINWDRNILLYKIKIRDCVIFIR